MAGRACAFALLLTALAASGAWAQEMGHKPKQALDDRADPRMRTDDVGQGSHYARKPTQPGAYFNDRSRAAVRNYYASHQLKVVPGQKRQWQIGEPLPAMATTAPVPPQIAGSLPKRPPGHRYVQVAGDILLIAVHSRMVVDGIAATAR